MPQQKKVKFLINIQDKFSILADKWKHRHALHKNDDWHCLIYVDFNYKRGLIQQQSTFSCCTGEIQFVTRASTWGQSALLRVFVCVTFPDSLHLSNDLHEHYGLGISHWQSSVQCYVLFNVFAWYFWMTFEIHNISKSVFTCCAWSGICDI